jgi:AcrR family transcriptional regulator
MKTKDKIINKAIEMYNALGVANVSSRNISKELGISHGNLEYHFNNKSVLLIAIYSKMTEGIANVYEDYQEDFNPIEHFQNLLSELEKLQQAYLFFNLDLLEIARKYPEVKAKLDTTLQLRKQQTYEIIKRLIDSKFFKEEPFEGCYLQLQHTIRILITFWKSQEEILVSFSSSKNYEMSLHIWSLLRPHLTEKGGVAYHKLIEKN